MYFQGSGVMKALKMSLLLRPCSLLKALEEGTSYLDGVYIIRGYNNNSPNLQYINSKNMGNYCWKVFSVRQLKLLLFSWMSPVSDLESSACGEMSGPAWHTYTMKFFTVSSKMACWTWQMPFICFVPTMFSFHVWQRPFTPSQKAGTTILYGLKVDSPRTSSGFWVTWRTLVTQTKICRFVDAQTQSAVYKSKVPLTSFKPQWRLKFI